MPPPDRPRGPKDEKTSSPLPTLSSLHDHDEEDEGGWGSKDKSTLRKAAPSAPLTPSAPPTPPTSRPIRNLPKAGPAQDPFSDSATKVAPIPVAPPSPPPAQRASAAAKTLPALSGLGDDLDEGVTRIDAAAAPTAAGAVEITSQREKSDRPEPTIAVADEFLKDMGVTPARMVPEPPADVSNTAPPRPVLPPASFDLQEEDRGESTRIIAVNTVEQLPRYSAPVPVLRAASTPLSALSGPLPIIGSESPEEAAPAQEATRIVSALSLKELHEPRAKRTRSQALVTLEPEPKSKGQPSKPVVAVAPDGKEKKNFIALIKAKAKLKIAPIDPGRLLVQQEAAERRAHDEQEKSGVNRFLSGLDEHEPAHEGTMIGRFLGLVGLGGIDKPTAGQGGGKDNAEQTWELVSEAPFLDGLNPQYLKDAIAQGDVKLLSLGRDFLVESEGRTLLICEGQVAMARFSPTVLERERRAQRAYRVGDKKAEKREQNRRQEVGPLIRLTESNLAIFPEGDVVSQDLPQHRDPNVALFTVTPAKVLAISAARLESWRRMYQFFAERSRNAAALAHARLEAGASGARSLVADFFVRHGMSVAMTLRVREVDKCIECYECEKACEERYGVKRLSLKGKTLGALDFVDCCRTCLDQRCVDVCGYDSIKFDPDKKEVLINEETCTGCSMCSIACPYDAIEMHELEEKPLLQIRLKKENKLGFGDGKARKAAIRRIASKCDHCISYEDQACISACPTSALLEITPASIFQERTQDMEAACESGFQQQVHVDLKQLYNPEKFFKGLAASDDKGRAVETRFRIGWLWVVGLIGFFLCSLEILLRKVAPTLTAQFYYNMKVLGYDADLAAENISFSPGGEFALWLGYIGAGIMFSSMFYSAHKWIPGIKKLGSQRGWFDFHIWAGVIGPLLVILHTAGKMDNWVSLAVWAMVATTLAGVVGRYLSTELPDLANQATLRALDLERQMAELRNKHGGISVADRYFEGKRREFAKVAAPGISGLAAGWMAFRMLLKDRLIGQPLRTFRLSRKLRGVKDRRARRLVARITAQLVLLERQRVLLPRVEPLFHEWKTIHIPFALVLVVLASIHIGIELLR